MKLQVLQENLAKAVSLASRFTSSKVQLPILGNVLLSTKKTKLLVSSTNLEVSTSTQIGAKIEKEGEVSIPSKVFSELVINLPRETLVLESEKEQLKISVSSFSSTILGMNASDFPKIPTSISKEKSVLLPREVFADALAKVIFATSVDETRPILTGVLFILGKGELSLVATDGFRLSLKKIKSLSLKGGLRVTLPKLVLSEIVRIEGEETIYLELAEKEKQIIFGVGDVVLSSRLLEGEFPDFEKIIPKESRISVRIDKEELLRAVKLASIFARDSANIVKMKILKDAVKLFAESSQAGNQETKVDAKVEGSEKEFEIAFNFRFLEEFLNSVKGEEVKMEFSGTSAPGVFTDPSDSDYLHLIMPVKIQG